MSLLIMLMLAGVMATSYYSLVVGSGLKNGQYRLSELLQWRELLKNPPKSRRPLLFFQVALLGTILLLLIIYLIS